MGARATPARPARPSPRPVGRSGRAPVLRAPDTSRLLRRPAQPRGRAVRPPQAYRPRPTASRASHMQISRVVEEVHRGNGPLAREQPTTIINTLKPHCLSLRTADDGAQRVAPQCHVPASRSGAPAGRQGSPTSGPPFIRLGSSSLPGQRQGCPPSQASRRPSGQAVACRLARRCPAHPLQPRRWRGSGRATGRSRPPTGPSHETDRDLIPSRGIRAEDGPGATALPLRGSLGDGSRHLTKFRVNCETFSLTSSHACSTHPTLVLLAPDRTVLESGLINSSHVDQKVP